MIKTIEELTYKGFNHEEHNEDSLVYITSSKKDMSVLVVFDGCSSGKDSFFASHLCSKVMSQVVSKNMFKDFGLEITINTILTYFLKEIYKIINILKINDFEILTTVGVTIIDHKNNEYVTKFIGDGVLIVDKQLKNVDQNNCPDYFIYKLREFVNNNEKMSYYLDNLPKFIGNVNKYLALSTDGVLTTNKKIDEIINIISDVNGINTINVMKDNGKLTHYDDLTIIKYIN